MNQSADKFLYLLCVFKKENQTIHKICDAKSNKNKTKKKRTIKCLSDLLDCCLIEIKNDLAADVHCENKRKLIGPQNFAKLVSYGNQNKNHFC